MEKTDGSAFVRTGNQTALEVAVRHPTLAEAVRTWLKIGLLGFGGPAGQIALMHRIVVDEKRWIDEPRFLHALNYCMLLPGPEAQQLAVYLGWLLHRHEGRAGRRHPVRAAGRAGDAGAQRPLRPLPPRCRSVEGLFWGSRRRSLAVVVEAVLRIGRRALRNRRMLAIAAPPSSASSFSTCRSR